MNEVFLRGGTSYKNTLKGGLIGKIKTLNEKFTKIQDGRSRIKEAE
jgi:hypothetical protein